MPKPISDLSELLRSIAPRRNPGVYVFAVVPFGADLSGVSAVATFREAEGLTVVAEETEAVRANLPILFRAAWITLSVHSDLQAVGLTAAFATALADAGISCNVVAAVHHDHIFVPVQDAERALDRLRALQDAAGGRSAGR